MRNQEEPKKRAKKRLPKPLRDLPASPPFDDTSWRGTWEFLPRATNLESAFKRASCKEESKGKPKGPSRESKASSRQSKEAPKGDDGGPKEAPKEGIMKGPQEPPSFPCPWCGYVGQDRRQVQGHVTGAHLRGSQTGGAAGGGGSRNKGSLSTSTRNSGPSSRTPHQAKREQHHRSRFRRSDAKSLGIRRIIVNERERLRLVTDRMVRKHRESIRKDFGTDEVENRTSWNTYNTLGILAITPQLKTRMGSGMI